MLAKPSEIPNFDGYPLVIEQFAIEHGPLK
jgi:hypothetical protein